MVLHLLPVALALFGRVDGRGADQSDGEVDEASVPRPCHEKLR